MTARKTPGRRLPPVGTVGRRTYGEEYSAGGVVKRDGRVLLVRVKNLKGEEVWTFPLGLVRYMFMRDGRLVRKRVRWYRMTPVRRTREPDAVEVLATRWATEEGAAGLLRYPGDVRLLNLVYKRKER